VPAGQIILLNGVSSSGKSTLARILVEQLPGFFPLAIDDFDLLIERMEDRPNQRLIPLETERLFHLTIVLFASQGVNLVVDTVLHDPSVRDHCREVLGDFAVLFVGVHCPAAELVRREQARGDRESGLACRQLAAVHKDEPYAVEVDTFQQSSAACAEKIIAALRAADFPQPWRRAWEGIR
jgi:chloramphenicol 3-O phosphotransferase